MGACCESRIIDENVMNCLDINEVIEVMNYYLQDSYMEKKEIEEHPQNELKRETLKVNIII